jgi:hypothetical protein
MEPASVLIQYSLRVIASFCLNAWLKGSSDPIRRRSPWSGSASAFCERVSAVLERNCKFNGLPSIAWDEEGDYMKCAQAVVWGEADVVKD